MLEGLVATITATSWILVLLAYAVGSAGPLLCLRYATLTRTFSAVFGAIATGLNGNTVRWSIPSGVPLRDIGRVILRFGARA